jgi:uncharacterized protein YjbI with pentapeptide repeats
VIRKEIMVLREELKQLGDNTTKDKRQLYKKIKQYLLISLFFILAIVLLIPIPQWQESGINNSTVEKASENPFLSFLLNNIKLIGFAGLIGLGSLIMYYRQASGIENQIPIMERQAMAAEKQATIMEKQASVSEKSSSENQKIEVIKHYSQAIDKLGSEKIDIRLGAISELEIIANESDKYYWPIIEILTAYVRNNSLIKTDNPMDNIVEQDIQAVLTALGRRKNSFKNGEPKGLNLRLTYLIRADLQKAHLEGIDLWRAHLEGIDLWRAHLEEANLQEAHLEGANLTGTHLEGAFLLETHLEGADLKGAYLKGTYLKGARLEGAHLFWTDLTEANLEEAHLEESDLMVAHLERAYLKGTHLERANLNGARLEEAYLIGANLEGASLIAAYLQVALLKGANLEGADLTGAILFVACLQESNLKGVNLLGARLEGADLKGADLSGAKLNGAKLKGAKNLTVDQLSKAKTLYQAELDGELEKPLREEYPDLFDKPKDKT